MAETPHDQAPACCGSPPAEVTGNEWRALGGAAPKLALFGLVVCSRPGCQNRQGFGFESRTETYGDLLDALEAAGWYLGMVGARVEEAFCPPCDLAIKAAAIEPAG